MGKYTTWKHITICTNCRKVEDVESCILSHFQIFEGLIMITRYCENCKEITNQAWLGMYIERGIKNDKN